MRVFRLTVQIFRDLKDACDDSDLRQRIGHAISRISRGVVDPKAELLAGMEAAPGPSAATSTTLAVVD